MIVMPESRIELMKVILDMGYAPWQGNVQWSPIAEQMGLTHDAVRNQYRRMCEALNKAGYTVEQFAQQCQENGVITTELPSGTVTLSIQAHQTIQDAYRNTDGRTVGVARLAQSVGLHPQTLKEYIAHHGFTRNDEKTLVAQHAQKQAQLIKDAERFRYLRQTVLDIWQAKNVQVTPLPIPQHLNTGGDMVVLTMFSDLHYGKVGRDYNPQIAKQRLSLATQHLLASTSPQNISRVIVPIGGDAVNVDNMKATTTAGTPQSNVRVLEMLTTYPAIMLNIIDAIRLHFVGATIELVVNSGNHDEMAVILLGQIASAAYRNTTGVKIHEGNGRVYVDHGKTLICFTHGDRISDTKIGGVMAGERATLWGRCQARYVVRGHYHSFTMGEHNGVLVVGVPALSGIDDWHDQQGYVTSRPGALALTFNDKNGLANITPYWA